MGRFANSRMCRVVGTEIQPADPDSTMAEMLGVVDKLLFVLVPAVGECREREEEGMVWEPHKDDEILVVLEEVEILVED